MNTYTGAQLDRKIASFMDKKMQKFPELQMKHKSPEPNNKKLFLRSFVHDLRFVFAGHAHA